MHQPRTSLNKFSRIPGSSKLLATLYNYTVSSMDILITRNVKQHEINSERAFIFLLERRRGDARRLFVLNFFPIGQSNSETPLVSCTSIKPFILGNWPATLRCQNNSSDLENCGDDPIPLTYKLKQV